MESALIVPDVSDTSEAVMTEIRDIRPTDPLWQKRRTEKIRPDEEKEDAPRQEKPPRRDDDEANGEQRPRDGHIDEYA